MSDNVGRPERGAASAGRRRRWNQRAFVAAGALLSGSALPLSGLADHVARESGSAPVGWASAHAALGALCAGFCVWHVILNRRALLRCLRAGARSPPSREALLALAVTGVVAAVTIAHAVVGP